MNFESQAKSDEKKINKAAALVKSQRDSILGKIDSAAKGFSYHFGDKRADLDAAILQAGSANSLKVIDDVLKDPKFFSLAQEVQDDKIHGPAFMSQLTYVQELFNGDGAGKKGLIEKALDLKNAIDAKLTATPADQNDIDRLARSLDQDMSDTAKPLEIMQIPKE